MTRTFQSSCTTSALPSLPKASSGGHRGERLVAPDFPQ
jgi:hypothetical protein